MISDSKFDCFYKQFFPRVLGFFSSKGILRHQALEFTQDVFLGVYIHRMHEKSEEEAVPWLFAVARNKAVSHYRAKTVHDNSENAVIQTSEEWSSSFPDPQEVLAAKDRAGAMILQLERMPEMMRTCLVLRYYHELSYEEMADFLKLSINTIKTHLKRGMEHLRGTAGEWRHG